MADVKTEEIEALGEMADVRFGFGPAQPTWCEPLGQERLGLHAAISGGLLSAVISIRCIFGFRKDNPNVFNSLIQNWPHF